MYTSSWKTKSMDASSKMVPKVHQSRPSLWRLADSLFYQIDCGNGFSHALQLLSLDDRPYLKVPNYYCIK